jgi:hypothetical protein
MKNPREEAIARSLAAVGTLLILIGKIADAPEMESETERLQHQLEQAIRRAEKSLAAPLKYGKTRALVDIFNELALLETLQLYYADTDQPMPSRFLQMLLRTHAEAHYMTLSA